MGKVFYINEILDFAIEREQESYDLYNALQEQVEDQKAKKVFETLKGEEQKHKDLYTKILSKVEHNRTPSVEGYDEYDEYMQTLIESRRTIRQAPSDLSQILDVLNFAIEREKDAVLFYVGLENYVPEENRSTVKDIIKEEGSHIVKLSALKKEFA